MKKFIEGLTILGDVFGDCSIDAEHDELFITPYNPPYDVYGEEIWPTIESYGEDCRYPPQLTEEQVKRLDEIGISWSDDHDCFQKFV